jgi:hypothetical protein
LTEAGGSGETNAKETLLLLRGECDGEGEKSEGGRIGHSGVRGEAASEARRRREGKRTRNHCKRVEPRAVATGVLKERESDVRAGARNEECAKPGESVQVLP